MFHSRFVAARHRLNGVPVVGVLLLASAACFVLAFDVVAWSMVLP